ncbi:MAG TPA: DNA methyltransferase, partial [Thermoguttaceae bacterium]|nr:DNA methyltransferase [Thermoguttaceae bacterium]
MADLPICHDGQTVYAGDVLQVLPQLPADHFHCVVTSPPYWKLRSYLPADDPLKAYEIGSEATPEAYIETIVAVFREVRRVMHPTGLLFLNLGDSYGNSGGPGNQGASGQRANRTHTQVSLRQGRGPDPAAGQLLNMPHRVAEALRADGWHWRQTIVWRKLSPMPES